MDAGLAEEVNASLIGRLRVAAGADTEDARSVEAGQGCHYTAIALRDVDQTRDTGTSGRVGDAAGAGSDAVDTVHTVAIHDAAPLHRCAYSVAMVRSVLVIVVLVEATGVHIAVVAARRVEMDAHIPPDRSLFPTSDAEPHPRARSEGRRSVAAMASVSAPGIRIDLGETLSFADED